MNIGATNQEVQESKNLDLSRRDRRYPRRDSNKTIYYYQSKEKNMIIIYIQKTYMFLLRIILQH